MNANITRETIRYTISYMTSKLIEAGYTEGKAAEYMTSDAGIKQIFALAAKFNEAIN